MTGRPAHYDRDELIAGLRSAGVERGDTIFSHVGLGMLGFPAGVESARAADALLDDAFAEVLGPEGTLLVPTYSYSYCKGELYDPVETPSTVGAFTNYFRQRPGVRRSLDPIFSVAGRGPATAEMLDDLPSTCFGPGCVYDRLKRSDARICNVGVGFRYATFVHHAERMVGVPYRFRKAFPGETLIGAEREAQRWIYYVRALIPNSWPDLRALERLARERGLVGSAQVGRGEITCISCADLWSLCTEMLERDRWALAAGPPVDVLAAERERVPGPSFALSLPDRTPAAVEVLAALAPLPRHAVSDGYDAAMAGLVGRYPIRVHRYRSGEPAGEGVVPERWVCGEAWVEDPAGERIVDYAAHPTAVASYSQPFEGSLELDALRPHLCSDPARPAARPWRSLEDAHDWGFSCPDAVRRALSDGEYRVVLRSERTLGEAKVGEMLLVGRSPAEVLLCARLSGPGQANAGLSGAIVALEALRRLATAPTPAFSYRLILAPAWFGLAAYLDARPGGVDRILAGLYLDHLGTDAPHVLRRSAGGGTPFDALCARVVAGSDPAALVVDHGALPAGEERTLEGWGVPGLSLYRLPAARPAEPLYPVHGTDMDTASAIRAERLESSVELLLGVVRGWEAESGRGVTGSPRDAAGVR